MERTIKEQEILELFEKFLLDNNVYSQFSTYLLEQAHTTIDGLFDYVDEYYSYYYNEYPSSIDERAYSFFCFTINYTDTKEGFEFWKIIESRWRTVLGNSLKNS